MTSTKSEAAAAVRIGAGLALRNRDELLGLLRPCFARTEPWLQAGKYVSALASELPRVNGWSIARHGRDRTPDRTQRLLNHASWDTSAAMSVVRRFAAAGLEQAAQRGRRGGMVIGAIDETGQEKAGEATAGVKRQYLGCAGRVANGINTVHLSYVRDKAGHALIGARQWIPREQIEDPVRSLVMGLPLDLVFRTKGQLAIDVCAAAYADGIRFDFACGDEVYGSCTQLREFFEARGQAYVLRVPSNFTLPPGRGRQNDLRGGRQGAAEAQAALGDPLRGHRLQGPALVCLGVDRHRLPAAPPAGPPPPEDRGPGLPLLLGARRAGHGQGPADPRRRAQMAGRSRPPLLPVKRDLSFTAALLVLLPAFRRFLPGVVPSGRGCSSRAGGPCARGARASGPDGIVQGNPLGIGAALDALLGPGRGICLEIGCGTGTHASRLPGLGWTAAALTFPPPCCATRAAAAERGEHRVVG